MTSGFDDAPAAPDEPPATTVEPESAAVGMFPPGPGPIPPDAVAASVPAAATTTQTVATADGQREVVLEVAGLDRRGEEQPGRHRLGAQQRHLPVDRLDDVEVLLGGRVVPRLLEGGERSLDQHTFRRRAGRVEERLVVEVGALDHHLGPVVDLGRRLEQLREVLGLTDEGQDLDVVLGQALRQVRPVGLAEDVVAGLVQQPLQLGCVG